MSSSAPIAVSVDVNAQTGAAVNAPVITGNTIGSVTFNAAGNGTITIAVLTETHCLLAVG